LSKGGQRKLVWSPRSAQEIETIRRSSERAAEAIFGFERVVVRIPEMGMAVPRKPGFFSRPFHTDRGSFLVTYTFNDEEVFCIAVQPVPASAY
jgi:hypothetical protein